MGKKKTHNRYVCTYCRKLIFVPKGAVLGRCPRCNAAGLRRVVKRRWRSYGDRMKPFGEDALDHAVSGSFEMGKRR